jgi:flagellar biosynthesis protein FlhB
MADDSYGDKTEPATPKRRQEARDSGQVAKSQDLTSATLLLVALIALSMTAHTFVQSLADVLRALLGNQFWGDSTELIDNSVRISIPHMVRVLAPVMIAVAIASFLITGLQVGFHVSFMPLAPKLNKLNPMQGFRRLFAGQNLMQLAMNLGKLLIIGVVAWNEVRTQLPLIISLVDIEFPQNFALAAGIIYGLAWRIALALFILAAVDWIYHKWKFERDIRMSKQEIKDEAKRMEGDQAIKGRRRQLARKMILQRIHRDVPKADVVVTNPTELAIAIRYDPENMAAPRVVAKGAGFLAARIRQIAIANGVPILERKPLAQALYKAVDVGQEVPPEFYQTIAEILAYVYELAGKGLRRLKQSA